MNDSEVILKTLSPALYDPEISEYEEFVFQVYAANSTTDIRGIVLDDNHIEKMKKLSIDMKIYYNTHESEPKSVKEGEFYSVFDNDWFRVQCISCNYENQTANVFFIDRGDKDTFPIEDLQVLSDKFCSLPAQSVKLTLWYLEIFSDCNEIINCMNDLLVGNNFYVKVMSYITNKNDLPTLSVLMTNAEESTEKITVNDQLLEEILLVVSPQDIFKVDGHFQVDISHIGKDGIFIHIRSKGLTYLHKLMHCLSKQFLDNKYYKLHHTAVIDPSKIYVAKNLGDNNWYRVKVIEVWNENKAKVEFIDFGKTTDIQKENLVLLESLSKFLIKYPAQAIQVMLDKISPMDFDKNVATQFRQLTFYPGAMIAKKVGEYENYPVVKMYKRSENNNLISINDQIFDELLHRSKSQISFLESPFPEPDIPEDGDYFDVTVVLATHPDDFIVQPLNSIFKFKKLMEQLLEACEEFRGPHLTSNCIKVGGVYAALNRDDDCWYRGYVSKIITETNFLVYACDYGDYKIVKLDDLQPLQPEFLDFPYLAIKAKLVGVAPEIIENWTVDNSINFEKLIMSKNLVSVIDSREVNELNFNSTVLKLRLFNTDTEEDINIADIINSKYKS